MSFLSESNITEVRDEIVESARVLIESLRMSIGLYQLLSVVKSKDALETL